MPDVDAQLREYWSGVAAKRPLPSAEELMAAPAPLDAASPWIRRGAIALAAAAVVALLLAISWLWDDDSEGSELDTVDQPPVDLIDDTPVAPTAGIAEIAGTITFDEPTNGLVQKTRVATPEGDVWLLGQGLAFRLDPTTGKVDRHLIDVDGTDMVQMPVNGSAAALVDDFIYVADGFGGLARFDRRDQSVTHRDAEVCEGTSDCLLEVIDNTLWAADGADILRVDPDSGAVTDTLELDPTKRITAMTPSDEGGLWVTQSGSDETTDTEMVIITRIDPEARRVTHSLTAELPLQEDDGLFVRWWRETDLVSTGADLWAVGGAGAVRIDTTTRAVTAIIELPGMRIGAPLHHGDALWILATGAQTSTRDAMFLDAPPDLPLAHLYEGQLIRIDATTGAITDEIDVGGAFSLVGQRAHDVLVADGGVWMIDQAPDSSLIRFDLADGQVSHRMLLSEIGLPIGPVDPEAGPTRFEWFAAEGSIWVQTEESIVQLGSRGETE